MNRGAQAIEARADANMARDKRAAVEAEERKQDALMLQGVDSLLMGYLGGMSPARRIKACKALTRAVLTAYRADMDSAAVTSLCGELANELGGDLLAPRRVKHASAHAQFDRLTRAAANDGKGA